MKYIFNFENKGKMQRFNRERLLLAAVMDPEQLYYMLDTQYGGICPAEALERRRLAGPNSLKRTMERSGFNFLRDRKEQIISTLALLYSQKVATFRNGYFFTEIPCEDLVPGDVVFISRGDIIPADVRLLLSEGLRIDQSLYGREYGVCPKESSCKDKGGMTGAVTDLPDLCFTGTAVTEGLAKGVVITTGLATYLGHLLLL